jgi:hypothetical protein
MRRRWSDDERTWGPFTLAPDRGVWEVMLSSGDQDYPGVKLRLRGFRRALIISLPTIIQPHREKVTAHSWNAETVARMGRDWYWLEEPRCFGFYVSEGHFVVKYGRDSNDSRTEQYWSCFLPWTQWRHVRHTLYNKDGAIAGHIEHPTIPRESHKEQWARREALLARVDKLSFAFLDFDGEAITATTFIEEREWRFGTGAFRWLSLFRKAKVGRYLEISFSKEVGERKGSWKGGTIGHSIEMLPGELHAGAFRRYAAKHGFTDVHVAQAVRT